jgi:hypothetical protein
MNKTVPALLKIFIILCVYLLIVPFSYAENKIKEVRVIKPEGFVLKKVGSHYVPVEKDYKSFFLPGTDIRVGLFRYINKEGDDDDKIGFLFGNNRFFFVDQQGGCYRGLSYTLYKNYLLIDGDCHGHFAEMYLFKYDKNTVRLLDFIGSPMVFYIASPADKIPFPSKRRNPPVWVINDAENIKLGFDKSTLPQCFYFENDNTDEAIKKRNKKYGQECEHFFDEMVLYLKISDDRLRINYDPKLYNRLFKNIQTKYKGKPKSFSYYYYGYLAKKLKLDEIKSRSLDSQIQTDTIDWFKDVYQWDFDFHSLLDFHDNPPMKIIPYKLK